MGIGSGKGNRIVKPRSARQHEQAEDYGGRGENVVAILPRDAGLPTRSWWADPCGWDEFHAKAAREEARMNVSKIGRAHGNGNLTER